MCEFGMEWDGIGCTRREQSIQNLFSVSLLPLSFLFLFAFPSFFSSVPTAESSSSSPPPLHPHLKLSFPNRTIAWDLKVGGGGRKGGMRRSLFQFPHPSRGTYLSPPSLRNPGWSFGYTRLAGALWFPPPPPFPPPCCLVYHWVLGPEECRRAPIRLSGRSGWVMYDRQVQRDGTTDNTYCTIILFFLSIVVNGLASSPIYASRGLLLCLLGILVSFN